VAGIASVNTGEPLTISLNIWANSGVVDSTQRPNISGKAQDGKMMNDWLNVKAFSVPTQGTFGNAGVGIARLPRTTQIDSSIYKDFHLYNQLHMQFRFEAINALNHTLFNGVSTSFSNNPIFGHVTSATAPRLAQAGVHFNF